MLRNNVIRLNSSRGVQMYTQMGQYGTLDAVTLERNRIYQNGHRDYEDGVVVGHALINDCYDGSTLGGAWRARNTGAAA